MAKGPIISGLYLLLSFLLFLLPLLLLSGISYPFIFFSLVFVLSDERNHFVLCHWPCSLTQTDGEKTQQMSGRRRKERMKRERERGGEKKIDRERGMERGGGGKRGGDTYMENGKNWTKRACTEMCSIAFPGTYLMCGFRKMGKTHRTFSFLYFMVFYLRKSSRRFSLGLTLFHRLPNLWENSRAGGGVYVLCYSMSRLLYYYRWHQRHHFSPGAHCAVSKSILGLPLRWCTWAS